MGEGLRHQINFTSLPAGLPVPVNLCLGSPLLPPPAAKKSSAQEVGDKIDFEMRPVVLKFGYCLKVLAVCVFLPKLMSLEKGLEPPRKLSRSRQPCRRAHSKQSWPWVRVLWVMSPSEAGDQDQGEAGTIVTREARSGEHFTSRASVVTTIWDDSTKKV